MPQCAHALEPGPVQRVFAGPCSTGRGGFPRTNVFELGRRRERGFLPTGLPEPLRPDHEGLAQLSDQIVQQRAPAIEAVRLGCVGRVSDQRLKGSRQREQQPQALPPDFVGDCPHE